MKKKKKTTDVFAVSLIRCGNCGHVVTAMGDDSAKAAMLDHLTAAHSE